MRSPYIKVVLVSILHQWVLKSEFLFIFLVGLNWQGNKTKNQEGKKGRDWWRSSGETGIPGAFSSLAVWYCLACCIRCLACITSYLLKWLLLSLYKQLWICHAVLFSVHIPSWYHVFALHQSIDCQYHAWMSSEERILLPFLVGFTWQFKINKAEGS